MRKVFKLDNLDCANCAAKMENAIAKLPEVSAVTVSFMTQKMIVEYAEGVDEAEGLAKIKKTIHRVEPDCEVVG